MGHHEQIIPTVTAESILTKEYILYDAILMKFKNYGIQGCIPVVKALKKSKKMITIKIRKMFPLGEWQN